MAINWHVSREEVEQTQHEAINAYYQHALNDPAMSREEAIQTTAQMAEQHEAYMEAFDAEQAANAQAAEAQEAAAQEAGGMEEGGVEEGGAGEGGAGEGGAGDGGVGDGGGVE